MTGMTVNPLKKNRMFTFEGGGVGKNRVFTFEGGGGGGLVCEFYEGNYIALHAFTVRT